MAIDGTTIREGEFWDEETGKMVQVNLTVRDLIFFRLLKRIEASLKHG